MTVLGAVMMKTVADSIVAYQAQVQAIDASAYPAAAEGSDPGRR